MHMNYKATILLLALFIAGFTSALHAAGLVSRTITITSNERFELVNGSSIQFKFQPLTDEARALEITNKASSLGVVYLGQLQLKENITALSALRSIADQIAESLDLSFGVITDSNTSTALKANELLLLYHPAVTITLALARPNEQNAYEIICTYTLKELATQEVKPHQASTDSTQTTPVASDTNPVLENEAAAATNP